MRIRIEHTVLACGLALIGLSTGALILLRDPASRLSRFVDRNALPYGMTR